jgi:rhamnulose-1-phosphate aldolase/alcohol dehydrogenase
MAPVDDPVIAATIGEAVNATEERQATPGPLSALIERSNRLGADTRNTNEGGGNTSAKGVAVDPVSGDDVELLWVKGSGSDLATLTAGDIAVLERQRIVAMQRVYRGPDHEDEMVPLFTRCCFGEPGPAPSIDTAMHALVDAPHVDHLHPDGVIAIAASVDGPELTERIYGGRVLWVDWRRPGFELGLQIARLHREHPEAVGVVLGGHGTTAWGATSAECEANSLWMIRTAEEFLEREGCADPLGAVVDSRRPLDPDRRAAVARVIHPMIRACASHDEPMVGHWDDSDVVLDFVSRERAEELAALGTSCPDHYLRLKVAPMFLDVDLDVDPAVDPAVDRSAIAATLDEAHRRYRDDYAAYYRRHATDDSPPMRGADPRIVLVPGVGMFSFAADARTARVCGAYYVNAINSMRGAESVSTYRPILDSEKFRIEYWSLEEAKLRRKTVPMLSGRVVVVAATEPALADGLVARLAAAGAHVETAEHDIVSTIERCAERFGGVDTVVATSAAIAEAAPLASALADVALTDAGGRIVVIDDEQQGGATGSPSAPFAGHAVASVELVEVGVSDATRHLDVVSRTVASIAAGALDPASDLNIRRIDRAVPGTVPTPSTHRGEQ